MKFIYNILISIIVSTGFSSTYCQESPTLDLSLIKRENIEFEALKPFFYLIRQDYIIVSETDEIIKLGGNDFFGRDLGMGFLTEDRNIIFPGYIRHPWEKDKNFNEYRSTHRPECTYMKTKHILDSTYSIFDYHEFDDNQQLLKMPYGRVGIPCTKELIESGTLIIFYSDHPVPEDFDEITYSIIYLNEITWKGGEVVDIRIPYVGKQLILGGALFQRLITKGMVKWNLSGIYVPVKEDWIIKSIN